MAFSTVEFVATAATGGLLGGFVQQYVQWRMARVQRRTEDQRRAEDRENALADRRLVRREAVYVNLLTAVKSYEVALRDVDRLVQEWGALQEMATQGDLSEYVQQSLPRIARIAIDYVSAVHATAEALRAAVYKAFSVASDEVRDHALQLADGVPPLRADALAVPPGQRIPVGHPEDGVAVASSTYATVLIDSIAAATRTAEALDAQLRKELDLL